MGPCSDRGCKKKIFWERPGGKRQSDRDSCNRKGRFLLLKSTRKKVQNPLTGHFNRYHLRVPGTKKQMCCVFRKALTLAARGSYLTSFCLSKVYNQSAYSDLWHQRGIFFRAIATHFLFCYHSLWALELVVMLWRPSRSAVFWNSHLNHRLMVVLNSSICTQLLPCDWPICFSRQQAIEIFFSALQVVFTLFKK